MRLHTEGTIAMTGATVTICPTFTGGPSTQVWVGAGDSNSGVIRVGAAAAPQLCVETTNKVGFMFPEEDAKRLVATGTAADVLRYAIWV